MTVFLLIEALLLPQNGTVGSQPYSYSLGIYPFFRKVCVTQKDRKLGRSLNFLFCPFPKTRAKIRARQLQPIANITKFLHYMIPGSFSSPSWLDSEVTSLGQFIQPQCNREPMNKVDSSRIYRLTRCSHSRSSLCDPRVNCPESLCTKVRCPDDP